MRHLLIILSLTLLAMPAWSADEPSPQNSIGALIEKVPASVLVGRTDLDELGGTINVHLKAGFRLALVFDRNTGTGVYCADVPVSAPLIMAVSPTKVIGIFQEDTATPLLDVVDAMDDSSLDHTPDSPKAPAGE